MRRPLPTLIVVLSLLWSGCAHRHRNTPLERHDPDGGYRFNPTAIPVDNTNSLFVCLTFSGGGTRAAALSYGVLKKLAELEVEWSGRRVRLLDEVDLISAVSGGAFTAAYYRLFGNKIFEDFESKFLRRDLQGELTWKILNPWNWLRMMSFWFDRIDLAAELYDETVFDGKTFADMSGSRPFVVINATNMAKGSQFSFTQDQFDLLGSDLDTYPVANAVAASSAIPVALSPVTLENHPRPFGYRLPDWIQRALKRSQDEHEYRKARDLAVYHANKDVHPYVHLIDGSASDNLGLGVLLDEFRAGFIRQLSHGTGAEGDRAIERIERLLVIVVNARTKLNDEIDQSSFSPGMVDAAYSAATVSIDHYSLALLEMVRETLQVKRRAEEAMQNVRRLLNRFDSRTDTNRLPPPAKLRVDLVEINFDQIKDREKRDSYLQMPTSFVLEPDQVDGLIEVADELLMQNPDFRRFLSELAVR